MRSKQSAHLPPLEFRRGLVENDEARALNQRPRDLDDLPLLDREPRAFLLDVEFHAPACQHALRLAPHRAPADPAEAASWLHVQQQVFRHRQRRHERGFLVDAGDAVAPFLSLGDARRIFSAEADAAGVRGNDAGQHADQRRFAGAVSADQRAQIACRHAHRDVAERLAGAETFRDARHLDDRRPGRRGVRDRLMTAHNRIAGRLPGRLSSWRRSPIGPGRRR